MSKKKPFLIPKLCDRCGAWVEGSMPFHKNTIGCYMRSERNLRATIQKQARYIKKVKLLLSLINMEGE